MIKRLLIANRGEIAVRIIAACRELGVESVAVYSEADARALHVAAADHAVAIGPAPAVDSYLSIPRIINAAKSARADAIHPGYGFLSENPAFAAACEAARLVFVGPPASVMAQVGSKIDARRVIQATGVPIVPGDTPADQSDAGLRDAIRRVGLPALVKASAGGGGKGMRRVLADIEIDDAIHAARREATAAFGDGTLYVERLIERPHHVEVQIIGDTHGNIVHVFERECSIQRRHQKVIEESPSPSITRGLRDRITRAGVQAARAVSYRNAGTVEFLVDLSGGRADSAPFYFLEINARLQVEHPVTEQTVGVDLVRAQLLVASGEPLPWRQETLEQRGHAIEARVYAEDPARDFLPQAGQLQRYREPRLPGVRVDSGVTEGAEVPVHYDPLLAKVIASAETRDLAIARLSAALRAYSIGGIETNLGFLLQILDHPGFRAGDADTGFLDREGAAIAVSARPEGRAYMKGAVGPSFSSGVEPHTHSDSRNVWWDPWTGRSVRPATPGAHQTAPHAKRKAAVNAAQSITAPMPATVIKVLVKPGQAVKKGDTVVVLEAMKMELPLRAAGDATVKAVRCREGELVQPETVLVELV
jgi:acetyl/propionyl-CoA carboxylase alpha subunit